MAQDLKLNVSISGNFRSIERSLTSLGASTRKVGKSFDNIGKSINKVGRQFSLFVTGPLAAIGVQSLRAFDTQQKAIAQVEAGLIATGNQAGFTSKQLQSIASELQGSTLFGDEEILKGATSQLLTFTNIAGNQFERTQRAALDLATRLDGDLLSSSIQLGKALNDPVANLSALSRSGIQFSKDQKDLINSLVETNRLADAQTIILDELEKQYGGSAEAAARAGLGPFKQFQNVLGDLSEDIGEIFAPAVNSIAKSLTSLINNFRDLSPETRRIVALIGLLVAAIGPGLIVLGTFTRLIGFSLVGLTNLAGVVKTVTRLFFRLLVAIGPIGAILIGIGLGIAEVAGRVIQLRRVGLDIGEALKVVFIDFLLFTQNLLKKGNEFISSLSNSISSFLDRVSGGTISLGTFEFEANNVENIQALEIEKKRILDAAGVTPEEREQLRSGFGAGLGVIGTEITDFLSGSIEGVKKQTLDLANSVADGLGLVTPKLKEINKESGEAAKKTNELITELKDSAPQQAASGLAGAFSNIADGSKNAKDAFSDFASSFLENIAQMILQSVILQSIQGAISSFSGGSTPNVSSTGTVATGGFVSGSNITKRFAEGGMVSGEGTGTSDSIVARLSDGEFVSDARTVGFFGPSFFQNLKRVSRGQFQMPAFNQGGFVGMASGSEFLPSQGGTGTIEIKNSGSPKEVSKTLTREEAQGTVTTIFLDDIQRNGPISKALNRRSKGPQR